MSDGAAAALMYVGPPADALRIEPLAEVRPGARL